MYIMYEQLCSPLGALFVLKNRPNKDGFLVGNNFCKKDMKIARQEAQAET